MKVVIGLGNPGREYLKNRHNVGFLVVDALVGKALGSWTSDAKLGAVLCKAGDTLFAKPQTFMNKSGESVSKILSYYKIKPSDLIVVHDDVDLEFGRIKSQFGGGSAGHHGIENIVSALGVHEFGRIRVGIGHPEGVKDVSGYVLADFTDEELQKLKNMEISLPIT